MTKPKPKDTVDTLLRVRAARGQGFRRAGHQFGREPRDLPLSLLSEEQVAELKAEPNLVVEEIEPAPGSDRGARDDAA